MGMRRRTRLAGAHRIPGQEEEACAGAAEAVRAEGIPAKPSTNSPDSSSNTAKPSIIPFNEPIIPAKPSTNPAN